jgi:hypothetical protein
MSGRTRILRLSVPDTIRGPQPGECLVVVSLGAQIRLVCAQSYAFISWTDHDPSAISTSPWPGQPPEAGTVLEIALPLDNPPGLPWTERGMKPPFVRENLSIIPNEQWWSRSRLGLSGGPVSVADGLCVQLGQGERGRYRLLAGDGRAELRTDNRAEVLELRDVQEPDAGVGHRPDGRMR